MAEIKFECPNCGQHIATDDEYTGMSCECPTCSCLLLIPQLPQNDLSFNSIRLNINDCDWDDVLNELNNLSRRAKTTLSLVNSDKYVIDSLSVYYSVQNSHYEFFYRNLDFSTTSLDAAIDLFRNFYALHEIPSNLLWFIKENGMLPIPQPSPSKVSSPQTQKSFFKALKNFLGGCFVLLIIIVLIILFCVAMLALDSTKTSSSSSNAGGYKCNGCSTAWSPTPFPGGYCTKCSDGGYRPLMEKFAERLIKEETGLDSDVRLEKNNGRYEYKVRYK